jgi:hypothetical protein
MAMRQFSAALVTPLAIRVISEVGPRICGDMTSEMK